MPINYLIKAQDISKHYAGKTALNKISLKIRKGQVFGLLGPNGAGKTTFIRILNGILKPDSGTLIIEGKGIDESTTGLIGYLPEERGLYKKMKVLEHLIYLGQLKGLSKNDALEKATIWLRKFGIEDWHSKTIEELSKGMAQKIQFIATVLHDPTLLILDEPFSGFDPVNTELIKQELLELKKNGTTIILSTHNMNSVEELCDEIALLHQSEIVLQGKIDEVKAQYKKNEFEVVFDGNMISFSTSLWTSFELLKHETLENKRIKVKVAANNGQCVNDLIAALLPTCKIWSVTEFMPSMHEIFIETVGKKSEEIQA